MKTPLTFCVNGDGRPVQPPSRVLCQECLAALDAKFQALAIRLSAPAEAAAKTPAPPDG